MDDLYFCPKCTAFGKTEIKKKTETLKVIDKDITLDVDVRYCATCGGEVSDTKLDNETLQLFYREYRKAENLLQPEEIKQIRENNHLSIAAFAEFLGVTEKEVIRFERGAIQERYFDDLIRRLDRGVISVYP